jgi:hypothetical protein
LEDPDVDGRLKLTVKRRVRTEFIWLGKRTRELHKKAGKFLEQLRNCQILKNDAAPWS